MRILVANENSDLHLEVAVDQMPTPMEEVDLRHGDIRVAILVLSVDDPHRPENPSDLPLIRVHRLEWLR